jgi:hypothetical protein
LPTSSARSFEENPETWNARNDKIKIDPRYHGRRGRPLAVAIAMLPTPRANKSTPQEREDFTPSLAARIAMLPTPHAFDWNVPEAKAAWEKRAKKQAAKGVNLHLPLKSKVFHVLNPPDQVGSKTGLKLQPAFVEWMMGLPDGWTDLER